MNKKIIIISFVIVCLIIVSLLFFKPNKEIYEINLSEISTEAKWFDYTQDNVQITFFAVKANDGTIKTAFNACDVCYGEKKGYSQDDKYMVCNNCGNRYKISDLGVENKLSGGCWPGHLSNTIKGNKLLVKVSDITKGGFRFA